MLSVVISTEAAPWTEPFAKAVSVALVAAARSFVNVSTAVLSAVKFELTSSASAIPLLANEFGTVTSSASARAEKLALTSAASATSPFVNVLGIVTSASAKSAAPTKVASTISPSVARERSPRMASPIKMSTSSPSPSPSIKGTAGGAAPQTMTPHGSPQAASAGEV